MRVKKGIKFRHIYKIQTIFFVFFLLGFSIIAYITMTRNGQELEQSQLLLDKELIIKLDNKILNEEVKSQDIVRTMYDKYVSNNENFKSIIGLLEIDDIVDRYYINKDIKFLLSNYYNKRYSNYLDIIIYDTTNDNVIHFSGEPTRTLISSEDFKSSVYNIFDETGLTFDITAPYVPSYISSDKEVISYYINLYDVNYFNIKKPIGIICFNIDLNYFISEFNNEIYGDLFIFKNDAPFYTNSKKDFLDIKENNSSYTYYEGNDNNFTYYLFANKKRLAKYYLDSFLSLLPIFISLLVIAVLLNLLSMSLYKKRIRILGNNLRTIEKKGFSKDIVSKKYSNDEIGYLEDRFNKMNQSMEAYIEREYRANIRRKKAEIKALQAQINPHYMYNTLESIRMNAITEQDENTADMIALFGEMFRWNVKNKDILVTIKEEFDYIDSYIELQKIRFRNSFKFSINIKDTENLFIPKLIIQPIIENSLYYGKNENDFAIEIISYVHNEYLEFIIFDNGIGMEADKLRQVIENLDSQESNIYSIGLRNVHQRIKLLFGEEYGVSIESSIDNYTKVSIKLPIISDRENYNV